MNEKKINIKLTEREADLITIALGRWAFICDDTEKPERAKVLRSIISRIDKAIKATKEKA